MVGSLWRLLAFTILTLAYITPTISQTMPPAGLPAPTTPNAFGGVKSLEPKQHQFLTGIGTNGVPITAQPDATDISSLSINTLADLKALVTRPSVLKLAGLASANDGGGGDFAWIAGDDTPADDAVVIAPANGPSGRYKRIFSGALNVLWFGADPRGASDSIVAFNTAIATGKDVYIPAGNYTITAGWIDMTTPRQRVFCDSPSTTITVSRGNGLYAPSPALIIDATATDARFDGCMIDHNGQQFLGTGVFVPLAWNNTTKGKHASDALGSAVLIMADGAKFSGFVTRGWDNCIGLGRFDLISGAQSSSPAPLGPVVAITTTSHCGIGSHNFRPIYNQGAGVNVLTASGAIVSDSVDWFSYDGFWIDTSGGASASFSNLTAFYTRISSTIFSEGWRATAGGVAFYLSGSNINFNGTNSTRMAGSSCVNCTAIQPMRHALIIDPVSNGTIVTNFRGVRAGLECVVVGGGQHRLTNTYCDTANYLRGDTSVPPGMAAPQTSAILITATDTPGVVKQLRDTNVLFDGLTVFNAGNSTPNYSYALSLVASSATPKVTITNPNVAAGAHGTYSNPSGTKLSVIDPDTLTAITGTARVISPAAEAVLELAAGPHAPFRVMQDRLGNGSLTNKQPRANTNVSQAGEGSVTLETNGIVRLTIDGSGNIIATSLPSSCSGRPRGTLWSDNGTVKMCR